MLGATVATQRLPLYALRDVCGPQTPQSIHLEGEECGGRGHELDSGLCLSHLIERGGGHLGHGPCLLAMWGLPGEAFDGVWAGPTAFPGPKLASS